MAFVRRAWLANALVLALACGACSSDNRTASSQSSATASTANAPSRTAVAPVLELAWSLPLASAPPGIAFVTDAVTVAPDGSPFVVDAARFGRKRLRHRIRQCPDPEVHR